jgi:predicted dehydrogenase
MNRRRFIIDLGAGAATMALAGNVLAKPRKISANEKLNIAVIGTANRAYENIREIRGENIVALCDVDDKYLAKTAAEFPGAKTYNDFRKLLEQKDIDAVLVATPDHTHAVAAVAALKSGRHVYCEKPLARTISEVRMITETARKKKLVTQIGTQIHAGRNYRNVVELIQSNAIGEVKEVHVWVNVTYGGMKKPTAEPPVPSELHYDLWLGPVEPWPYEPDWVPKAWRNWWHFGGGALGDFGCHYMDLPFWALGLHAPTSAEAEGPPVDEHSTCPWLIVRYQFPTLKKGGQPLPLTWYHGGRQPSPDILAPELASKWKSGVLFIGENGRLISDYNRHELTPAKPDIQKTVKIPDSIGHHKEWIEACKAGDVTATSCKFDYSGPLTEAALLGNVAYRVGKKLEWDTKKMKVTNTREAEQYIQHRYRKGWNL